MNLPKAKTVLLAVTAAMGGYLAGVLSAPNYSVEPLSLGTAPARAKLYDGAVMPEYLVKDLDAGGLFQHMQQAAWTNASFMRKGAWIIELNDKTRICVSYYGGFFWVGGKPGYFVIPESDYVAFGKLVHEKLAKPTIEWRTRRNAAGRPISEREEASGCKNA